MVKMRYISKRPIGIFDSGVGGLTVFKAIEKKLPNESIVYLGDTARVPYGNKSKQTVIRFSTESVLFLLERKVKLVVIACNTSSSLALDYLKRIFSVPIIGVIEPAVNKAISISKNKKIGVIGTKSTIDSKIYERQILGKEDQARVYSCACPLFVPLVEEGLIKSEITKNLVRMYLSKLRGKVDTLILGCTHYPLLKKAIASYLKGVYLVDSAQEVASNIKTILEAIGLLNSGKGVFKEFYVTDEPVAFSKLAKLFLGRKISKPKVANV
jgi:glutamate racemase